MTKNIKFHEKIFEQMFEFLEKRKMEIEEFQNEIKNLDSKLCKPWAKKEIIPWEERRLKDPYYSDHVWQDMKIEYTIIFPPFVFDYNSPETFVIKGKGGKIRILGEKTKGWDGKWSKPFYYVNIMPLKEIEMEYPPDFIGKTQIIRDIDYTLQLLGLGYRKIPEKLYWYLEDERKFYGKIEKLVGEMK